MTPVLNGSQGIVCACHILHRFNPSYMMHPSPLFWGKVRMEKMAIITKFGPVLLNSQCIGYILSS